MFLDSQITTYHSNTLMHVQNIATMLDLLTSTLMERKIDDIKETLEQCGETKL